MSIPVSKETPVHCAICHQPVRALPAKLAARPAAAAAANVTDKAVTGVDEAAVAAFLANFKANWGSGT